MSIFEAIILGIVQGVSEFLPISSSGHLILLKEQFGLDATSLTFDVAVHVATLLAIIWVLRKEVLDVLRELTERVWYKTMLFKLAIATIPVGVVGVLLSDSALAWLRTSQVVAFSLIFWGLALWWMDGKVKKKSARKATEASWRQSIVVGCAQVLALIPGTSRSGVTMIAGMGAKMNRLEAARFSFLLSIPALTGAGLVTVIDVVSEGSDLAIEPMLAGFIGAFISGLLAARFLLAFLTKYGFRLFAVYRIFLGLIVLSFLWF